MKYPLDAPLKILLDIAGEKFKVHFEPVTAGGRTLRILQISDMETYVDKLAEEAELSGVDLPFWAKIWPASVLISHYIQSLPVRPGQSMLEVGAGVGVSGLFAAAHGFEVVISDINPEALLFTQINILENELSGSAQVRKVDFARDRLKERFDFILGSEILYIEDLHRPLIKFLLAHISRAPEAEIILGKNYKRKAARFFKLAAQDFLFSEKTIGCRTKDAESGEEDVERHLCTICRLKARKQVGA